MPVGTGQRFTKASPCPICGGYDKAPRGQGTRCFGFLSTEGKRAFCTRSEKAGGLPVHPESETYTHKLAGSCDCGSNHGSSARTPRGDIEATYDYRDETGALLFQVVRMLTPAGGKAFVQRRPDLAGGWLWKLAGVRRVLYRLPELLAAPLDATVFVVEGEKDVNRLWSEGAVATTNPQGALKWRAEYANKLQGRHVVVLPDNDPRNMDKPTEDLKGQQHAAQVARTLFGQASSVKVLELPGLPLRGDVSDWLDAGRTMEELYQLVAAAPEYTLDNPYHPGGGNGTHPGLADTGSEYLFVESKYRPVSKRFMRDGILQRGSFILAEGRFYYFDDATKTICELESFEMEALLSESYELNSTEPFFKFLLKDMRVECHQRGRRARISALAQYDPEANILFLDLGQGRMLRLDGTAITEVDNGSHGVLFAKTHHMDPWTFIPNTPKGLIGDTLIRTMNFVSGEGTPFDSEQQQLLLFIWMLSIAFESIQPTKPLALAMGPAGSGKSSMFRRIGRMLYGPDFEIDGIRKDGEDDFFVATTNAPFVAFDNVDRYISWLEDALATSATGMKVTKRVLYETNRAVSYVPRAFIALTARTPHFRREDVAERIIPFRLAKLEEKRAEYELLEEIASQRNALMSEYATALNRVVAANVVKGANTGLRLADFANVSTRIGASLGVEEQTKDILSKLQTSQQIYATEENDLYILLDLWTSQESTAGAMGLNTPNSGREIPPAELYQELKALADVHGYKWWINNETALGRRLRDLEDALGAHFLVERGRKTRVRWWKFTRLPGDEGEDSET